MSLLMSFTGINVDNGLDPVTDLVPGTLFPTSGLDLLLLCKDGTISSPVGATLTDSSGKGRNFTLHAGSTSPTRTASGIATAASAGFRYDGPSNYHPNAHTLFLCGKVVSGAAFPNFGGVNPFLAAVSAGDTALNTGVWLNDSSVFRPVRETNLTIPLTTTFAMAISADPVTKVLMILTSWGQYQAVETAAFASFAITQPTQVMTIGNSFNGSAGSQVGNTLLMMGVYNTAFSISQMTVLNALQRNYLMADRAVLVL